MKAFEHAYFLDGLQLLQLLSCLDDRPVTGFPLCEMEAVPESVWKHVLFSLIQDQWLQPVENGFEIPLKRALLLRAMKDAPRVLSVVFRGETFPVRSLYLWERPAAIEVYGPAYYRIYEIALDSVSDWLSDTLPADPMEEQDATLLFRITPSAEAALRRVETKALPFQAAAYQWGEQEDVHTVLDLYRNGTSERLCRWVWIELAVCGVILRQDEAGCHALPDTVEQRQAVLQACLSGNFGTKEGGFL